jgi:hypothetical protein
MDPHTLIDTTVTPGLPVPFWLIEVFKVAGFALHMVPMNLWFAGLIVAMIAQAFGGEHPKRWSTRLMTQMPIIVAMGVNFGIVPLLFIQVAYAKLFYPATILMAWFWLAVIVLLIPAYYGVYVYLFALANGGRAMNRAKRAIGWTAALMFIAISFIFVNAMTLLTNVQAWPKLWEMQDAGGAVLGTGLNVGFDPTLWPRWLMVFGIALTTSAVWVVFDAAWFGRNESEDYRNWAAGFAWKLYAVGLVWVAITGAWYMFGTWRAEVFQTMTSWPLLLLTAVTALSTGLPFALLFFARQKHLELTRPIASLLALAQLGVITVNGISRQVVQNLEVREYFPVADQPVDPQWGQLALFLVCVVIGLALVVWMILQAKNAAPKVKASEAA